MVDTGDGKNVGRLSDFSYGQAVSISALVGFAVTLLGAITMLGLGVVLIPPERHPVAVYIFHYVAMFLAGNVLTALLYLRRLHRAFDKSFKVGRTSIIGAVMTVISGFLGALFYDTFLRCPGVEDWADFAIVLTSFEMAVVFAGYWIFGQVILHWILIRPAQRI